MGSRPDVAPSKIWKCGNAKSTLQIFRGCHCGSDPIYTANATGGQRRHPERRSPTSTSANATIGQRQHPSAPTPLATNLTWCERTMPHRRGHDHFGTLEKPIAVGTGVASDPPHRSVLALLTHTAPTSGMPFDSLGRLYERYEVGAATSESVGSCAPNWYCGAGYVGGWC